MKIGKYLISYDNDRTFYILKNNGIGKKINLGKYRKSLWICDKYEIPFTLKIYSDYVLGEYTPEEDEFPTSFYFKNFGFYENQFKNLDWIWEKAAEWENFEYFDEFVAYEDYEEGVAEWMHIHKKYGNTMLFRTENENEYIFLGGQIYKFKTKSEILGFVSILSSDFVQHPYAYDDKYYYLLLEKIKIDNNFDHCKHDPYAIFYDKKPNAKKMKINSIIETKTDGQIINYFVRSEL